MPLSDTKKKSLEDVINKCAEFEGKYYLLHLGNVLINSKKDPRELDPIADTLIKLIQDINKLKNKDNNKEQIIKEISISYQKVAKETGTNGVFYHSTRLILGLGGVILAAIIAPIGAMIGLTAGTLKDICNLNLPTGAFSGVLAGSCIGGMIGYRLLDSLVDNAFKNKEKRAICHSVTMLKETFESLLIPMEIDSIEEAIKKEVLEENFGGNQEGFSCFLQQKHSYQILGARANFGLSDKLKGVIGHHSFIKFAINNTGKTKTIEFGGPSDLETDISQIEARKTTGAQLIRMLAMHRLLQQEYSLSLKNLPTIFQRYVAGTNDCHTYVDKILQAVGEPPSKITRFLKQDNAFGRVIGSLFQFFSPEAPKKAAETLCDEVIILTQPGKKSD